MLIRFRRLPFLLVLLATALLCGCSTLRLSYNNIDEVGFWWLNGYVDLDRSQAQRVRQDIATLHDWHRRRELPRIEAFLHEVEKLAPGDVSPAQACALAPQPREFLRTLLDQAEPSLVTLALSLGPDQLRHLEEKYRRNNAKFRKEWVQITPAQRQDKRYDTALERSERVYGRLGAAQRTALRQQTQETVFNPERTLAERQARQEQTLQLLRSLLEQRGTLAQAREQVRATLLRMLPDSPPAGSYQEVLVQENCRLLSALHNSTTTAQRDIAVQRLRGWQRDLRELAAQP